MPDYTFGRLRGEIALVYWDAAGTRHRHTLGTPDKGEAERLAPAVYAELTRPKGTSVKDLWAAYCADKVTSEGNPRRIVLNMVATWKAIEPRFGAMDASTVTIADCRKYASARRLAGKKEWTIYGELGHLRNVLVWAEKNKLIPAAPYIELPPQPPPKEHFFTRREISKLIGSAVTPHVRLFMILAIGTGARRQALFDLTWDRVDFERRLIHLKDPGARAPAKGRAIVPMNDMVLKAMVDAERASLSDYVIEYGGRPVKSVKRALTSTGNRAGVKGVTAHVFRHSAAVHMAEEGISMEEIAQYLGHTDVNTTRKVYARFSPTFLRKAAAALEYDV